MCHAHHVQHWIDGGETSLDNLILLCGHHHRLIHNGPWEIHVMEPGTFEFVGPLRHHQAEASPRQPPDG